MWLVAKCKALKWAVKLQLLQPRRTSLHGFFKAGFATIHLVLKFTELGWEDMVVYTIQMWVVEEPSHWKPSFKHFLKKISDFLTFGVRAAIDKPGHPPGLLHFCIQGNAQTLSTNPFVCEQYAAELSLGFINKATS